MDRSASIAMQTDRAKRLSAMKIDLALASFFSLAWCLLQWSLTAGEQFVTNGVAQRFAAAEALACAAVAVAALMHLAFGALTWLLVLSRQQRAAHQPRRLPTTG